MKNELYLTNANILTMIEEGQNLQFITNKKSDYGNVFTIEFVPDLGCWLTKTGETKGHVIDKVEVMRLFNTYCIYNTRFEFYNTKPTETRHEFKMTWVYNGEVITRTNFHPCTKISEVLNALQSTCIILSVEDLTEIKKYKAQ